MIDNNITMGPEMVRIKNKTSVWVETVAPAPQRLSWEGERERERGGGRTE